MKELNVTDALEISREIGNKIADLGADTIGAILAELTAMWVAGHYAKSGVKADTDEIRKQVLRSWTKAVKELVVVIDEDLRDRGFGETRQ